MVGAFPDVISLARSAGSINANFGIADALSARATAGINNIAKNANGTLKCFMRPPRGVAVGASILRGTLSSIHKSLNVADDRSWPLRQQLELSVVDPFLTYDPSRLTSF